VSREDVVRERLERQFGKDVKVDLVWVGPYAYKSQCVDTLQMGRVFFMGDTAKVVSPFGARGGNTGVSDADNLAWKLGAVLKGWASPALLDSYNAERLEAAQENVRVTNRTARFLRAPDGIERSLRNAAISLAKQYPFARSLINTGRMAVANTYTRSPVCADNGGISLQNVAFCWSQGHHGVVNDLLNWAEGRLVLLTFGTATQANLRRLRTLTEGTPLRCVQVVDQHTPPQAREHVIDKQHRLRTACQLQGRGWALVRPDGYLAATGQRVDGSLIEAIANALAL
jgi:3-(3-hydroxy-phenyl)propionate hydroxylase